MILWGVSFSFWYDDGGHGIGRGVQQPEYLHKHIIHPMDSHNLGRRVETQMSCNQPLDAIAQHGAVILTLTFNL